MLLSVSLCVRQTWKDFPFLRTPWIISGLSEGVIQFKATANLIVTFHTDHCGVESQPILATFYRNTTEIISTGCMSVWDCGASDWKISLPFACLEPKPRSGTPHTPTWTVLPAGLCKLLYNILHRFCISVPPGHQSAKPRMTICCSYCIFSSICFNI